MNPGSLQGGTIGTRRKPSEAHPLRSADTGAFAVESIRRRWYRLSKPRYPHATRLAITADCGGSNGPQVKLWKRELQRLANETGMGWSPGRFPARIMSRGGCTSPAGQTSNASDLLARYASAGRRCRREVAMDERVSGAEVLGLLGRFEPLHLQFSAPCRPHQERTRVS
jgi:hypothetical protein